MRISKGGLTRLLGSAIAAVSVLLAVNVFAAQAKSPPSHPKHGSKLLISASIAPSLTTYPAFHGVKPGAAPWVLKSGSVQIKGRRLDLTIKGLLIPNVGIGPVKTVSASLYCGADSSMTAAASTQQVPLSRTGNAVIHDRSFAVPSTCLAPVVLVHPNGIMTAYIALDGQR